MADISELAARQLAAYNASDLDAFVACYHDDVVVYDGEKVVFRGIEAFRDKYAGMFGTRSYGATVDARVATGEHIVERESYWKVDPETQARTEGRLLVRYTAREGKIAVVQFLRCED